MPSVIELVKEGGYFDQEGNLRRELVQRAQLEPLVETMAHDEPPLTMSQLRRFFQHCRTIESQIKSGQATWDRLAAKFDRIDCYAEDALHKSPPKIPATFHRFIRTNVAAVKTREDFLEGFLPHFEALIGFGAAHLKERQRST